MTQLIYVSSASHPMEKRELNALLEVTRRNNERDGITGTLVYSEGNFLEVLEGDTEAVHETFRRILKDTRHGGILVLSERKIKEREFAGWSMGWDSGGAAKGTVAWKLLVSFRRQMREHALRL
ncbi:MAG: BLUF domain-containing protein [Bryobacterales bacterium]|nr:BLUF domain-containing protein [Bryobacterales bacterium]